MAKPGSTLVLLLIDVINHFEYPDAQKMLIQALPIAPRIARVKGIMGPANNAAVSAKMRNFGLFVPSDCSASMTAQEHKQAIAHMQSMTDAVITPSTSLGLEALSTRRTKSSQKAAGKS